MSLKAKKARLAELLTDRLHGLSLIHAKKSKNPTKSTDLLKNRLIGSNVIKRAQNGLTEIKTN